MISTLTIIANNTIQETHASHVQLPNKEYKEGNTIYTHQFNRLFLAIKHLLHLNNQLLSHGFIDKYQHKHNTKTIRYKEYLEYKSITVIIVKNKL